ncbi:MULTISPECIES: cyclodeaminase/cyclohydrolase family protein [unclassified Sedimentibacter]|uniref:cyclodeaminase/cyclohydrolase family protein n=1 Tax=unclassified Sedimentibacter TaxID=2649220 RepID=UPI0027DFCA73|nr:cyclodeaminase/cyclohydrolase family protein [Sedimentibacter sp. MB35-C1]WMJ76876.1 cyclodeaminase/cyclohydrolase family protein [Sedimentibacter sp. MB35-C1]
MDYKSVLELILDTDDVTVGGGSASALSGALACGLIGMVCKLSTKKDFGISSESQLEYAKELEELREKLLAGIVDDANAYGVIINAYKLPKGTEEEKEIRKKAIADAGVVGATAPMENAKLCRRIYDIGAELEGKTNPNCNSDIVIGREMAKIGTNGCLINIEANLPLVKDEEKLEEFNRVIKELKIY